MYCRVNLFVILARRKTTEKVFYDMRERVVRDLKFQLQVDIADCRILQSDRTLAIFREEEAIDKAPVHCIQRYSTARLMGQVTVRERVVYETCAAASK